MKIAVINENSQASKNSVIVQELKRVVEPKGYEVYNYGMYSQEDENQITYVEAGLLTAILINSGAADFVVTGCGTGEGAMLALNSFPNVLCGHICDAEDAYMFSQINAGNSVAIPFAKGFGWGSELTLKYIFEKLFEQTPGGGYPKERAIPEQRNKKILDEVKKVTHNNMIDILENIDKELLNHVINLDGFKKLFKENARDNDVTKFILNYVESRYNN